MWSCAPSLCPLWPKRRNWVVSTSAKWRLSPRNVCNCARPHSSCSKWLSTRKSGWNWLISFVNSSSRCVIPCIFRRFWITLHSPDRTLLSPRASIRRPASAVRYSNLNFTEAVLFFFIKWRNFLYIYIIYHCISDLRKNAYNKYALLYA